MKVRDPQFDFSQVRALWSPNQEFAQYKNAESFLPSHVEPYLIKLMRKAKELIGPEHEALRRDIGLFIRQESQHLKHHNAFNQVLYREGYTGVAAFEKELADEFKSFLAHRSLKFNLAYAEGFESLGAVAAQVFFEHSGHLLQQADPQAMALWKWHLAEEFEHREVAYQVYMFLYGSKSFFNRYFYRLYGFVYAVRHLGGFGKRLAANLIAQDRAGMTAAQVRQSRQRERSYRRTLLRHMLPRLLLVLSPWYNPRDKKVPAGLQPYLDGFPAAPGQ